MGIALAVLDMAGTTVEDEGLVLACFLHAATETGLVASEGDVNARMGMGKLAVFHELATRQLGSGERAERLRDETYSAFRACLEARYERGEAKVMPGAIETFAWFRDRSVRVALNTGFYRRVTELLVERLGFGRWVDTVVCSDDVPEGRPVPYMIHTAMARLGVRDVRSVAVVGDTPSDAQAGYNAGAALVVGVCSGAHSAAALRREPLTHVVASVADVPALVDRVGRLHRSTS